MYANCQEKFFAGLSPIRYYEVKMCADLVIVCLRALSEAARPRSSGSFYLVNMYSTASKSTHLLESAQEPDGVQGRACYKD